MKKVLLDAGHGGIDPGAQSRCGDYYEKDFVLDITLATGRRIEQLLPAVEVLYTRIEDKKTDLNTRYRAIMDFEPCAFISLHCNAVADDPQTPMDERDYAEGFKILYRDAFDLPLAEAIGRLVERAQLWRKYRGIKQDKTWLGRRLRVLDHLDVPAVLVEMGFISSAHDLQILQTKQDQIADLLAHGICAFLEAGADEPV